ncbi:helix-turn-helix domain-containing protein [Limnohabitans sp.]|uniref:helix-turn-helix domain-containing protein n=1 Tax=Limnohabitans sp. TaxID=1907725 RepID=UPI00286F7B71|nr:helix-turn-helix domain-containing protein [Limnohabitans sp.]
MLIQKLRLQRGWSQQQLADLSGLSVRTIQRLEQGQVASTESLKSLAAVFEIDFSTLQEPDMNTATAPASSATFNADEALVFAQVRKLKGFYLHLAQYVFTLGLLLAINLWTHPQYLWVLWVALGWGIGVLFHGLRVFERFNPFGAEWEKKEVEKRLGRKI